MDTHCTPYEPYMPIYTQSLMHFLFPLETPPLIDDSIIEQIFDNSKRITKTFLNTVRYLRYPV